MDIDKLEKRIILLTSIGGAIKLAAWLFLGFMCVEALLHIDQHGLKHLIDLIWLGPDVG